MKRFIPVITVLFLLTGCVTKDYAKPNVTKTQFFSDKYECAWKYHTTKVPDVNINMPSNTGYAGAAVGGFMEGFAKQESRFDIYKNCMTERDYVYQEVDKQEYDKDLEAYKEYSLKRNIAEGKAKP